MTLSPQPQVLYYPSDIGRYDVPSRQKKAEKIYRILQNRRTLSQMTTYPNNGLEFQGKCLDIGCGPAIITDHLAEAFDLVVGIDLDKQAIRYGHTCKHNQNLALGVGDVLRLPLPSRAFDTVICAQVYEHVPDPVSLVSEIWRVLKPGGICFFSGPNRLAIMEEHYFLPFLSWLPRPLADVYVRLLARGDFYDASPWYPWQVKALWHAFARQDYTLELIRHPEAFMMGRWARRLSWLAHLPPGLMNILLIFLPNYNWILTKPLDEK